MENDIRWHQRFSNFNKALGQLEKFSDKKNLNDLEKQGLIKAFEYTYELAWNTMKDYIQFQGEDVSGPRDTIQKAFKLNIVEDGESWMDMLKSRNLSSHTYNDSTARQIIKNIERTYIKLFQHLRKKLESFRDGEQLTIEE